LDSSSKTQTAVTKDWLIRTKQKQILGPVSKEKLISFVEKGALGSEDEISSGNGYWFALKEKDLLDKYVLGDIPQSFDPISEAKTVLSIGQEKKEGTASLYPNPLKWEKERRSENESEEISFKDEDEDAQVPEEDDLAYPDFGDIPSEDERQTRVLELDRTLFKEKIPEDDHAALVDELDGDEDSSDMEFGNDWDGTLPDEKDLEFPDLEDKQTTEDKPNEMKKESVSESETSGQEKEQAVAVKKKNNEIKKKPKKVIEAPKRNDRYLFYILGLIVLLTLGVFYYYRTILNKPFPIIGVFVSSVQAQSLVQDPSGLKKKEYLNHFHYPKMSIKQKSV
jgi:hypothetical protein